MTHTKGPWKVDPIWGLILGPHKEEIAAVHAAEPQDGTQPKRRNKQESRANAHVLAAAPEMLDALKTWTDVYRVLYNVERIHPTTYEQVQQLEADMRTAYENAVRVIARVHKESKP